MYIFHHCIQMSFVACVIHIYTFIITKLIIVYHIYKDFLIFHVHYGYLNTAMQLCCRLWNLLKTVANSAVIVSLTLPYARFQQPSSPRVILMKHVQSALRIIRKARSFVYCLVHMVGWLFFGKHDDLYMSVMHRYSQ